MSDQDCLFCKFIAKQIPVDLVAENDGAIAFNDINPQAPVHVLVIPKLHVSDLSELSEHSTDLTSVIQLAAQVAEELKLSAGYRFVFNTGAQAGQSVFHAHGHLLGGRSMQWPPG